MAKIEIFSPLHKTVLKFFPFAYDTVVLPCGSKIHAKSLNLLRFSRYSHLFIFRWNPRWLPKVAKIEICPLCIGYSCTTLRVKHSLEIALSLTVFEIFTLFNFPLKSKMAAKSGENWKFYCYKWFPQWRTVKVVITRLAMDLQLSKFAIKQYIKK